MWPWGHLLFGYLVYTVGIRVWNRRGPRDVSTFALAFGTQFPDLIDKPANWYFDIYDGRAIGHSLFVMVPLCLVVYLLARKYERQGLGVAFAVGTLSHLASDALFPVVRGSGLNAPYLFWPLVPAPVYPSDSFTDHFVRLQSKFGSLDAASIPGLIDGGFGLYLAFVFGTIGIWMLDGFPGVGFVWRALVRRRDRFIARTQ